MSDEVLGINFAGEYYERDLDGNFIERLHGKFLDLGKLLRAQPDAPLVWEHPIKPLQRVDLASLQDKPVPLRKWAVPGWVPLFETTGLGGAGAAGKTTIAQMLATAAPLGVDWLGQPVNRMKTMLLLCEDRLDDFWIRQAAINKLYGCEYDDVAADMLVLPRRSEPHNRLMIFDRDSQGLLTSFFFQFLEAAKQFAHGAGGLLTFLDTKADVFLGDQNNEDHARTFVRLCTDRIAEETEGAVVLIYHPSRSGIATETGESGSVQWDGAFRSRLYHHRPKKKDGDDEDEKPDPYQRILRRVKANHALQDVEIEMHWEDGVYIHETSTPISGIEIKAAQAKHERVFLQLLDECNRNGRRLSDSPNAGNYAPKVMAKMPGREGVKVAGLKAAMEDLFKAQKIRMEETWKGRWLQRAGVADSE